MTKNDKLNVLNKIFHINIKPHGNCGYSGITSYGERITIDFCGKYIIICVLPTSNPNKLLNNIIKSKDIIISEIVSSNSDLGLQILFMNDLKNIDI